ncbi:MAG TPA: hypothetical protein VII00_09100 [bacterium]
MKTFIYFLGRLFQIFGLLITFEAIILFFGGPETKKLLIVGAAGTVVFSIGWLFVRKK